MDVRVAVMGLAVGIVVGLTGVGGSALMAPILILVMRINSMIAVGTDLVYSVPTKLLGALAHLRQGTVKTRIVRSLCVGGIPCAILGLLVLTALRSALQATALTGMMQRTVGVILTIGVLLLVVAITLVVTPLVRRKARQSKDVQEANGESERDREDMERGITGRSQACLIVVGAVVGLAVSLTSIGSGSITLLLLCLVLPRIGLRERAGSDITFAACPVPIAAAGQLALGNVNLLLALNLLLGSIPGVLLGGMLYRNLPDRWLRPAVATALALSGVRMA